MKTVIDFKDFKNEKELENYINNSNLEDVEILNLEKVGGGFLYHNRKLKNLTVPKLKKVENHFMGNNKSLENLTVPNLKIVGHFFLHDNENLKTFRAPKLEIVGNSFMYKNRILKTFRVPKLKIVGNNFMYCNENLGNLTVPNLEKVGDGFMYCNKNLGNLTALNLKEIGDDFLYYNENLNIYNIKTKIKTVAEKDTIVFKKMRTGEVIQLLLQKGTKFQTHGVKSRAEYLFAIEDVDYRSFYNEGFAKKYNAGDKIEPNCFNERYVTCSNGIHFFFNEEDANNYEL